MKNIQRYTAYSLSFIVFMALFYIFSSHAHAAQYTVLEPFAGYAPCPPDQTPCTTDKVSDFATYLSNLFKYLIRIAGILSVVMLVVAGVEYTAAGVSESRKDDAKKRINNVFIGLAGALSAYFVLNIINPDLVNFKLKLDVISSNIPTTQTTGTPGQGGASQASSGGSTNSGAIGTVDPAANEAIARELAAERITLGYKTPCSSSTERGCLNLAGLPANAKKGLIDLRDFCKCAVQLNGATEPNGHSEDTKHGPGNPVVDVQTNSSISAYVERNGTKLPQTGSYPRYQTPLGIFQDERVKGHWHVTFK